MNPGLEATLRELHVENEVGKQLQGVIREGKYQSEEIKERRIVTQRLKHASQSTQVYVLMGTAAGLTVLRLCNLQKQQLPQQLSTQNH